MAVLEHVNITLSNTDATVALLENVFDWRIRWQGPALGDGKTIHIGSERNYLALYTPAEGTDDVIPLNRHAGTMNHIGIVVDDLTATEKRVKDAGYEPFSHADYEPGRRFYFMGPENVEYEIICYNDAEYEPGRRAG